MYTKSLLLIVISIIISSSMAVGNHSQKMGVHSEKNTEANSISAPGAKQPTQNLPYGIDFSDIPHQDQTGHSNSHSHDDDDGKSHHFHFEHFTHSRRNRIFSIVGKLILLITFISSLISGFYLWQP